MSLNETFQQIVDMSTEDKVRLAAASYSDVMPVLRQIDTKNNGMTLLFAILGSAAGADGALSGSEVALIRAILKAENVEMSNEQVLQLVQASTKDSVFSLVKKLAGVMSAEQTASLVTLMAAIAAIDDKISKEEAAYIVSLLE